VERLFIHDNREVAKVYYSVQSQVGITVLEIYVQYKTNIKNNYYQMHIISFLLSFFG